MTQAERIEGLIARGLQLNKEIAEREADLKVIEDAIERHVLAHPETHEALADDKREGRRALLAGPDGNVLPVVLTADKLITTYEAGGILDTALADKVGGFLKLDAFFERVTLRRRTQKDGKKFRAFVRAELGDKAEAFLQLCLDLDKDGLPKSDVQIRWQDVGPEAVVRASSTAKTPKAKKATNPGKPGRRSAPGTEVQP